MTGGLLLAFLIIFGVNLLPAFGPPTWALLVFFRLSWHLNPVALVLVGLVAATTGRVILALAARWSRDRLPSKLVARLTSAEELLGQHRRGTLAAFALFVVSPLPSAQLFVAAGLLRLPLVPITAGFVVGRTLSYSLYVGLASVAAASLGSAVGNFFGSPWAIALQVILLGALAALPFIDWGRFLRPNGGEPDDMDTGGSAH